MISWISRDFPVIKSREFIELRIFVKFYEYSIESNFLKVRFEVDESNLPKFDPIRTVRSPTSSKLWLLSQHKLKRISYLQRPRIHSISMNYPVPQITQSSPTFLHSSYLCWKSGELQSQPLSSNHVIISPVTPEATADSQTRPPVSHQSATSPPPERTADTQDQRWRRSRSKNFSKPRPTICLHDSTKPNFGTERNLLE